jgi:Fe-S cluster biogenesis protein NfuA/nitrite reductase/ring-hydroxylating ferredoxin subunit
MASAGQVAGDDLIEALAADELVSHLLLLHGLHPVDVETRVRRALAAVRPDLESHGGNVELRGVEDGVARLRLQGSCNGCPSSTQTLELAIEQAIQQAAPDLEGIEAEEVAEPRPYAIPLTAAPLPAAEAPPHDRSASWTTTGALQQLADNGLLLEEIAGEPVLFPKLEGDYYAYRRPCPDSCRSLARGVLKGATLTCAGCGHRYDVRRAGRCLDAPSLHLEPIPLLVGEAGQLRVAMPSAVSGRS